MKKMRAAMCTGHRKMTVGDMEVPSYGDDDVLVKIAYCGLCGSDVHWYAYGEQAFPELEVYPYVLGHEVSGTVVALGKNVKDHKIGDRVSLEPGKTCGKCRWCKEGKYNLCPDVHFLSAPPEQGAMREYVAHPADLCFTLPDNVSLKTGALVEPFSVGLHAASQGQPGPGKTVVILGSGCIGLVTMLACKLYNADRIIVVDMFDIRLQKALELGATAVINSAGEDAVQKVLELTDGIGADVVFETAGNPVTTGMTGKMTRKGGTITLVGNTPGETPFEFLEVMNKEITIKSVFRYRNTWPLALSALESGNIRIDDIISLVFPIEEAPEAFETALTKKATNVKVVLLVDKEQADK